MTDHSRPEHQQATASRRSLGLPLVAVVALALLAAPRVVLHDLDIIEEGTPLNAVFVFLPPLVWIAVVLVKRVPNPFLTILAVGACYGIVLALGHQLLWDANYGDDPPQLGGNLADLDPAVEAVIIRGFAVVSSVFTGVIVGAITGLIAWGLAAVTGRRR
ncbi:hypothetical protein [Jiangella gansuensis]|uniref:hypothetical protein n=1 Tax=Jiangella gansuensis TaxID=281473 RepID=UPI0004B8726C|nr:hypothetical protein [Jiangella gansuensis]